MLFGFAGTSLYQLFPGQQNIADRAVLLKNLPGKGISQIYGAAYDGYLLSRQLFELHRSTSTRGITSGNLAGVPILICPVMASRNHPMA